MSDKISLRGGKAYRGNKLLAWYDGDELKFKHWKFKKHKAEIEDLKLTADALAENNSLTTADDPLNSSYDPNVGSYDPNVGSEPQYPQELIKMGKNGAWFGEEHPYVVEWRKENWSKESFDKKYAHQYELLCNNYDAEGMKYQP
jgi:hypothetical protein